MLGPRGTRFAIFGASFVFLVLAAVIILTELAYTLSPAPEVALLFGFVLLTLGISLLIVNVMIQSAQERENEYRGDPALEEIRQALAVPVQRGLSLLDFVYGSAEVDRAWSHSQSEGIPLARVFAEIFVPVLENRIPADRIDDLIGACTRACTSIDREVREAYLFIPRERGRRLKSALKTLNFQVEILASLLRDKPSEVTSTDAADRLCGVLAACITLSEAAASQESSESGGQSEADTDSTNG